MLRCIDGALVSNENMIRQRDLRCSMLNMQMFKAYCVQMTGEPKLDG